MAIEMAASLVSPIKRKRSALDFGLADEPSEAGASLAETSHSRKRKKHTRAQLFDKSGDVDSNFAPSPTPSLADTNTATATIADTTTPLTEASSRAGSTTSRQRPKIYHCTFPDCNKVFDRPVRLQTHINSHTGARPHTCPKPGCDKGFFKPEHLTRHIKDKHSDQTYTCSFEVRNDEAGKIQPCGKTFESEYKIKRHIAIHEDRQETTCSWEGCGKSFRKQETLQRHIKKDHLQEDAYQCTRETADGGVCGAMFPTPGQLKGHLAKEHDAPKYVCDICTDAMIPPEEDVEPVLNDLDPEFLPTPEDLHHLGEGFDAQILDNLSLEEAKPRTSHRPEGVVCFDSYHDLQRHNRDVHPPECTECGKKCLSNKDLAAHIEIEHPAPGAAPAEKKLIPCPHEGCPRSLPGNGFTKNGNMKVHVKNAHAPQRKMYICGEEDVSGKEKYIGGWDGKGCGMALTAKQPLLSHIRTQHMGLPAIGQEQREAGRAKKAKTTRKAKTKKKGVDFDMDADSDDEGPSKAIALLTGAGYEELRPYACLLAGGPRGCQMRFFREYDLCTHLELTHGWNVDDINEAINAGPGAHDSGDDSTLRQQLQAEIVAMDGSGEPAVDPGLQV